MRQAEIFNLENKKIIKLNNKKIIKLNNDINYYKWNSLNESMKYNV